MIMNNEDSNKDYEYQHKKDGFIKLTSGLLCSPYQPSKFLKLIALILAFVILTVFPKLWFMRLGEWDLIMEDCFFECWKLRTYLLL